MNTTHSVLCFPVSYPVEVFRTNVQNKEQAGALLEQLEACFPDYEMNFDLEDCDRILRVKGNDLHIQQILSLVRRFGFEAGILEG